MFLTAQVSITLGVFAVAGFLLAVSGWVTAGRADP